MRHVREIVGYSAYQGKVIRAIESMVGQGWSLFTMADIAGQIGRKPTHNMRRALKRFEDEGKIESVWVYTDAGGMALAWRRTKRDERAKPFVAPF